MSHIRFDNGNESVTLRGAERHHMSAVCNGIASSVMHIMDSSTSPSWTRRMLPPGHYALSEEPFRYEETFRTWLRVDGRGMRHPVSGESVDAFAMTLNTALRLGSDEVRLMARLHGQCELHAFIPPGECDFVAGLVDSGLAMGLYRPGMCWEDVAALLRSSGGAGRTVVTSYSVTETFPGWDSEKDAPNDWAAALEALDPLFALRREDWGRYYFGNGVTAMSLEADWEKSRTASEADSP